MLKLPVIHCSVTLPRALTGVIFHISIIRWVYLMFILIYKKIKSRQIRLLTCAFGWYHSFNVGGLCW